MGLAAICWAIWNCRNRATFEHKNLSSPFEIVFTTCMHLNYWAGLLKGERRTELERRAMILQENPKEMMRLCATAHAGDAVE